MRRVGIGIAAVVLAAGLAASAASAQDADGDLHAAAPKPKAWWEGWFTPAAPPPEVKHDAAEATAPPGPSPVELAAAARQRERADLDRRWEVCDQLMEIAVRDNDQTMQTQIEQLRDRAWDVYQQHIADLSSSAAAPPPPPAKPKFGKPSGGGR